MTYFLAKRNWTTHMQRPASKQIYPAYCSAVQWMWLSGHVRGVPAAAYRRSKPCVTV